ncbi:MAG: hypothetical protein FH748_07275 [Balneolaceae bacterium]|nr:hypothetical protein [Balneolaceae bacterium]
MQTYADKNQEGNSQSIANVVSKKKSGNEPVFKFRDNRAETVQMLGLQEIANNHTKSLSDKTVQPMSANGTVVQRAIDISVMDHTQNDEYFIAHGGSKKLFSKAEAPTPQPRALYDEQDNTSVSGEELKVWKPRSKVADKKKISGETPVYTETGELVTDLQEIQETVLMEIMREIEAEVNAGPGRLGTAGINDCLGYATTLRRMIVAFGDDPQGLVGRTWVHQTNPKGADFPYHAATVVAQDGADAVTLEAHAGQDITVPVFHIRHGGKAGFEEANKASAPGKYQDEAHEMDREAIDGIMDKIEMLKMGWADVNSRSDKSNVYATGEDTVPTPEHVPAQQPQPQPESSGIGKWVLIGSLITAVIGGLIVLGNSGSK